ncbi:MAG: polymorphic toxin-type HINT domain-containing protein, partial [Aeoliella sp.]
SQGGEEAEAALADLRASVDESAIRAFEKLADSAGQWETVGGERESRLAMAFVDTLAEMPTHEATQSLVRFALLPRQTSLRVAATDHLAQRPKHEYMPLLLVRLASPIETHFDIRRSQTGLVTYSHEAFSEGRETDELREVSITGRMALPTGEIDPDDFEAQARARLQARRASDRQVRQFMTQAANLERQAAQENAQRAEMNERVVTVLEKVTSKDFGQDLRAWWNYWTMHNEYELVTYRPVNTYRDTYEFEISPPTSCECFVAGTPVWTKTGETPIEEIQEGDLVLTQDVETGELCFRPVTATTLREPTPIVSITAGDYQIEATLGHPFWVAGEGWRMAKELQEGDRLQSIDGQVEISAVEDLDDAEAHNLIVWGTNNYFVGVRGVLVHDNTQRRPDMVRAGTRE